MISIQSGMLIALGFLAATLLALLIAPAFWRRAVRLTRLRIIDTMPITDVEIRADKDRIRAGFAIKLHKLESEIEQVRLADARQKIELNRRDATINELEGTLQTLTVNVEEGANARRVLEQTVADRLPRLEARLNDAKKLLFARDREISELAAKAEKQTRDLAEKTAQSDLQSEEIQRLRQALEARQDGSNSQPMLEAELDALREKAREQAILIAKLQSTDGTRRSGSDQSSEIARLKASLAVVENQTADETNEATLALKSRVQLLEAQAAQHAETIANLRSELAKAKEREEDQAARAGTEQKRPASEPRKALSERIALAPDARSSNVETLPLSHSPATEENDARKSLETAQSPAHPAEGIQADEQAAKADNKNRPRLLDRISNLARQS